MYYLMKDDEIVMEINELTCQIYNKKLLPESLINIRKYTERILTQDCLLIKDIHNVLEFIKNLAENTNENDMYILLHDLAETKKINTDGYWVKKIDLPVSLSKIMESF